MTPIRVVFYERGESRKNFSHAGASAEIATGAVAADSILAFSLSGKLAAVSAFVFSAIARLLTDGGRTSARA
jgi:hypothetical protein